MSISWLDLEQQSLKKNCVSLQSSQCLVMQWQILPSLPDPRAAFPLFTLTQYPNLNCICGTRPDQIRLGRYLMFNFLHQTLKALLSCIGNCALPHFVLFFILFFKFFPQLILFGVQHQNCLRQETVRKCASIASRLQRAIRSSWREIKEAARCIQEEDMTAGFLSVAI